MKIGNFYGNGIASFYFYFKESNLFAYDIFPDLLVEENLVLGCLLYTSDAADE